MRSSQCLKRLIARASCSLLVVSWFAFGALAAHASTGKSCAQIAQMSLTAGRVLESSEVAAGAFAPPPTANGAKSPDFAKLPDFCRVRARLMPSPDSDIVIEIWLPRQGWNGRFVAVGNGGFQSSFQYTGLAAALASGYAAAGSNAGHDSDNAAFTFGHPEKLIDWGYRAIHEMTVAAKQIVREHYGRAADYSYWDACSTGGRQGLNAAERYPEDFDGLAIGAPANPMTRLQLASLWNNLAVNRSAESYLTRDAWQMIHVAVLAECDAADGLADGLINDPTRCRFDPAELACKAGQAGPCLSGPQIVALNAIYGGARNPRTGAQIYPGWAPSFEGNMPGPTAGKVPQQDAIDTFRAIFDQPGWDYHRVDFDSIVAASDARGNATINAADPSRLGKLFRHGGKILMYHGWNDVGISALGSLDYYQRAVSANGGEQAMKDSIRLFLAPGMNHCEGGDGPNQFDKLAALAAWVERGRAPDRIDAAHYTSAGRVDRTRPLCPYPKVAVYSGSGSIDDASNFQCGTTPAARGAAAHAPDQDGRNSQGQRS